MNAFIRSAFVCAACTFVSSIFTPVRAQSGATPAPQATAPATPQSTTSTAPGASSTAAPQAAGSADAHAPAAAKFTAEQIEQMVAPIALYPDGLLMQMLMAATYPLEVVQAQRWVEKNPKVTGKALEDALQQQTWDPSVKSLCGFPDVVKNMSTNLDWTQDLGDAFLGQKVEVLDSIQKLRKNANEAGNLKTTEQQTVTVETDKTIVIAPVNPQVIYVPTYSPSVVYVGWSYPYYYYPPLYPPPRPGYGLLAFGAGVACGAAIWGGCNWGSHNVNINVNNYNNFNRVTNNTNINNNFNRTNVQNNINGSTWQHNPEHRQGVNYRDGQTAKQYGAKAGSTAVSRDAARGYGGASSAATRPTTPNAGQRPATPSATQRPVATPSATQRPTVGNGASTTPRTSPSSGSGAFTGASGGSSSAGLDRAASSRGASSRGTTSVGGGARSGGGGSARGGGGGGARRA